MTSLFLQIALGPVERVGELLDALVLEPLGDTMQINSGLGEIRVAPPLRARQLILVRKLPCCALRGSLGMQTLVPNVQIAGLVTVNI